MKREQSAQGHDAAKPDAGGISQALLSGHGFPGGGGR